MSSAYEILKGKVDAGELELFLIISPPRTGSTRLGILLHEADVNAVMVEPAAKFDKWETRVESTYEDILQQVEVLEEKSPERPIRIVVKEITQHIAPGAECEQLLDLAKKTSVLVRNPVLALESHILLSAEILSVLDSDPKTKDELKEWVIENADLSHVTDNHPEGKSAWMQHVEYMEKHRDYSSLNEKLWFTPTNTLFRSPTMQEAVWTKHFERKKKVEGPMSWRDYLGTPLDSMLSPDFPKQLRKPYKRRQGGWNALEDLVPTIASHPSYSCAMDFSTMQLFPEQSRDALFLQMGLHERAPDMLPPVIKTGYGEAEVANPDYITRMFGNAMENGAIKPPRKAPVPFSALPRFMQNELKKDFAIYMDVLSAETMINPPGISTVDVLNTEFSASGGTKTFQQVDPVSAYIRATIARDMTDESRLSKLEAIRSESPLFKEYFDLVDKAQKKRLKGKEGNSSHL